jgi:Fe-S oxidoreductase
MNDTSLYNELLQLGDIRDQLLTCQTCTCGFCLNECQAYKLTGMESIGPRGRNHIALGILNGEIGIEDLPDLFLYACTTCRYCETICPQNTPLSVKTSNNKRRVAISGATTAELLRAMKVEGGKIPPAVRDVLKSFGKYGNPYNIPKEIKNSWVEGLGLKPMDLSDKEGLLYVGALVPYEDKSTKAAEAVFHVLSKFGLSLGMLGSEELSSGGLVRPMGEEWLCEMFVNHLSDIIKENSIERIICLSPHDYDAFCNYYQDLGIKIEHYTETIANFIENEQQIIGKTYNRKITYQDPCYLGRRNKAYDPPRAILNSIPGIKLIEMEKIKDKAHCCGGGGVGLWMEFPELRMDLQRADEAKETGAEIVATACPICLQMMDSAMKARNYSIEVKDIAQILQDFMK